MALFTWQGSLGDDLEIMFNRYGIVPEAMFAALPFVFFADGGLIVGIAALFRLKDLRRGFPGA